MIAPRLYFVLSIAACGSHPSRAPRPPSNASAPHPSAAPHELAALSGVVSIALDDDHVYVRTSTNVGAKQATIGRVERTGGSVEVIATGVRNWGTLATTPRFVWWIDDSGIARAEKGTTIVERLALPYDRIDYLASSGRDVWIAASDATGAQLLVFEREARTPREVLDLGGRAPYGMAGADGLVAISGEWGAYSVVRDGKRVDVEKDIAGSTFAVAGNRMVTANVWIEMHPLDGGSPRIVSEMKMIGLASPGCFSLEGTDPEPYTVRGMSALAGGGGRFAIASVEATVDPSAACRSSYTPPFITDGSGELAVIDSVGGLETIATGEDETIALAVDARGVVWSTRRALRAVDR